MFQLFLFAAIVGLVGIGILFAKTNLFPKKLKLVSGAFCILVCVVLATASCVRTVPTGHTGIVTTFGNVENYTYEAGVHFSAPWRTVINMDNRNQKASIELKCFSSDIQEVDVIYSLNYQISKTNAQDIYREIGTEYYNTVINPRIQEAVRSVMAHYTAEELLEKRAELSAEIKSILIEKLATYNIEVLDTALENLDFSDTFTDAVEAKQVAAQKKQQAEIEQEQALMEAEFAKKIAEEKAQAEASVATIAAEAELVVTKIQADAAEYAGQKDAAVIAQVRDAMAKDPSNLTDEDIESLLIYYYILQWNGELPETYIGTEDFYALLSSLATSGGTATPTP
ncbi:MAG: hypothetical protein IKB34_03715 [Clostridia bacterium]|nr:hypothetical protein [Clostridia bacterium]